MNIVVLAGGLSEERNVSLKSGTLVSNALIENGHNVLLLDAYKGMEVEGKNYQKLFTNSEKYTYEMPKEEPDLEKLKKEVQNGNSLIGKNVLEICKFADIVFIALHGGIGENGSLQAMFDTLGIKYTGSGYVGSLLAMDKNLTKIVLKSENIPTADWITINLSNEDVSIKEKIKLPCVIKPCSNGSSVGVSIVKTKEELEAGINLCKKYENKIIIEKYIKGREFSIGVLNGKALPPIEIIPKEGFYDYQNKYQAGKTVEECPAKITKEELKLIEDLAIKVHKALKLGNYSRIDFILDESTNEFVCLEANTLPGMTNMSLLPQEALAKGISYNELCEIIAQG
ncbi:MAG: D-alanine--D-alanine ligase [Lachnospiraceae bacterium]|jgi:D-alanine-D-alanine ligase|nr:D-alanine--D-alanine ligase [Lachnospiraceae bacterium]